jgi:hypothetical protein
MFMGTMHPHAKCFREVVDCVRLVPPVGPTGTIRSGDLVSQRSFGKIESLKRLLIFLISAFDM